MTRKSIVLFVCTVCGFLTTPQLFAAVSAETAYILNTLLFLIMGCLVMFMAAGFAMLEAGMVRSTSVATIILKNISLYSVAGLAFYIFGYNLLYDGVDGGFFGSISMWSASDKAAESGDFTSLAYASASDWFFQMVFVATTVSIVSGAVAERMKIEPFLIFSFFMAAFIYPISSAWKWGAGWLDVKGFQDFAGSTLVHSVGGWAALTGIAILGPRLGRFKEDGSPNAMLPSSITLVGLGVFILWLGWFGFNGGSQLALGSGADAIAIANIFVNTNIAAAAGVVVSLILTMIIYKRIDPYMTLNGALAGLVSITAEPLLPSIHQAAIIGAIGGVIIVITTPLLEKVKLDDVVGAVPVHLACGIWGTLIVPWTNPDASFGTQLLGVIAVGIFVSLVSIAVWFTLKNTVGLRLKPEEEGNGLDIAELGIEGYPYFERRQHERG